MAGKKLPALNSSSMSDISLLLLTFILKVTCINKDQANKKRFQPNPEHNQKTPQIQLRNTFTVLVNMNDNLLVNGEPGDINSLKDRAKEFLGNPNNDPTLPEKDEKEIPLLGKIQVSKGVISLQNDRGTSYDMYLKVQNELTAAVNELRDELSREKFSRKYVDCNDSQREAIDKAIPVAISEAEPKNIGGGQKTGGGK